MVLFVPHKLFKPYKSAASYLMSAAVVSFITTRHSMRDVLDEVEALEGTHTDTLGVLDKQIVTLGDEKGQLVDQVAQLVTEIEGLKLDLSEQSLELGSCQQALKQVLEFNKETAHRLVEDCYQVAMRKCVCHVESLHRNYQECQPQLEVIKVEIDAKKGRFSDKLANYLTISNLDELIDVGLDLQEQVLSQTIELRCKAQAVVITYLLGITKDAVPYPDFESYIEGLQFTAGERITQSETEKVALAGELVGVIDGHLVRHHEDVSEAIATAKKAQDLLNLAISELQVALAQVEQVKKPVEFTGGSSIALMANSVSAYYYGRYGVKLDALHWEETELGFKVVYSLRRNPGLQETELTTDNSLEQTAAFTNALHGTTPVWEFNRQFSQLTLSVQLRRPTKVKVEELPRGVRTADKFLATVKTWRRVRITGGSESGKSPTAENLVCALTTMHNGLCDFYDPQHDSVKNYRSIPAVGKSHSDSVQGLKDYQRRMQSAPSDRLYLAWFDEIDTTLDQNPKSASDLKAVLKQSSHKNCGLVITGQNANVRNLKGGFDRSDMNNFVCLHIGDNYRDAVANSHLSETEKANLLKVGDALTDWCAHKNEDAGLDHTDPSAYRFALVLEPNRKGYYMILPEFGEYVWQELADEISETIDTIPAIPASTVPNCLKCGGSEVVMNGTRANKSGVKTRYKCKSADCGHSFTSPVMVGDDQPLNSGNPYLA
ncbi:hypothetical protein QUA10_27625 [Microcoleus sp. Pol8_D6]